MSKSLKQSPDLDTAYAESQVASSYDDATFQIWFMAQPGEGNRLIVTLGSEGAVYDWSCSNIDGDTLPDGGLLTGQPSYMVCRCHQYGSDNAWMKAFMRYFQEKTLGLPITPGPYMGFVMGWW